jgi:hypothetical protein
VLPEPWAEWAAAEYPHWSPEVVRRVAEGFADHWRGKAGKDAVKVDWQATWRNWCRSDITQRQFPPPRANGEAHPSAERRTGRMTEAEVVAFNARANAEAARLLFGPKPPTEMIDA